MITRVDLALWRKKVIRTVYLNWEINERDIAVRVYYDLRYPLLLIFCLLERTNAEDTSIVEILKGRVSQLEASLHEQDDKHRQHVKHLDKSWKEREHNFKKLIPEVMKDIK